MVKPLLAVDFDDVLFPFMERLVPHYNEKYGANFHIDDYHTFDFWEVWGNSPVECWHYVDDFFDQPHSGIEPLPGSVEGVDALHSCYELAIVTARDESLRSYTEAWLNEIFPERFSHVHLCSSYSPDPQARRTKLQVVEELGAVALIDDSLKNVTAVAATGRRGLLFGEYAWNRSEQLPNNVNRYTDWPSIIESLVAA